MRTRLIATFALAITFLGCGGGTAPTSGSPTGASTAQPAGSAAASAPAGNAGASFCEAVGKLEVPMDRAAIQRDLEAATPAGLEAAVAVAREFMERLGTANDPYQDPDFLDKYDDAFHDLRRHCGIE
jgi:hypothetical protein